MKADPGEPPVAPPETTGREQFEREVFPQEMRDVAARRAAGGVEGAALAERPTTGNGLVGLALSGGGMRSASFNLGVLQALHESGAIARVDYLSTVSGGGWIGSCWSALSRGAGSSFPFDAARDDSQEVLNHIRDRSASLIPSGLVGGAGTAAQFIRGITASVVLLLPVQALLAGLSLVPVMWLLRKVAVLHGQELSKAQVAWFLVHTQWVALGALGWLGLTILLSALIRPGHVALRVIGRSYPFAVLLVLLTGVVELQPLAVLRWNAFLRSTTPWIPEGTLLPALAVVAAIVVVWPLLRRALPAARTLLLVLAMGLSVAGPYLLYLHILTFLVRAEVFGDARALAMVREPGWYALVALVYALTDVNVFSMHGYFREQLVRTFVVRRTPEGAVKPADRLLLSELAAEGSTAPVHLINATINLHASDDRSLRGRAGEVFVFSRRFVGSTRTGYCDARTYESLVPGMTVATAVAVSASAVSPNMGVMTIRPLVLLMTFLNLRLGYWLPNPRRMRRWAASPPRGAWGRFVARMRCVPRVECYLRELASWMHEKGPWVFLSDGGHLENTGAYELLRRRCRCVIVSDAEEDPRLEFGGLAALLRYARLDLGVEIDVDLDPLRPGADGRSAAHSVRGTIRYPATADLPEETGELLYLKSSLTGDEHETVKQYRAVNTDFPHESTADQVFDEAQFEAYRALGFHIARGAAVGGLEGMFAGDGEAGTTG